MENLKSCINSNLLNDYSKLKFKYPPISERINKQQKIMKVKQIYMMNWQGKDFVLIKVKNYDKKPKLRFFLGTILANQSSDLLVILGKKNEKYKSSYKLIQYPIYPQFHRIGLLCLTELTNKSEMSDQFQELNEFREHFRRKIQNLIKT